MPNLLMVLERKDKSSLRFEDPRATAQLKHCDWDGERKKVARTLCYFILFIFVFYFILKYLEPRKSVNTGWVSYLMVQRWLLECKRSLHITGMQQEEGKDTNAFLPVLF
ncbi:uncharacterized protein LOC110598732 isoform X3 [Ictidomys tridecemlineatus]